MNTIIYLEDRSGAETDDHCGMKYWWQRKSGPARKGLVPLKKELPLLIGGETHNDLATVADMEDISVDALKEVVKGLTSHLTQDDYCEQSKMELLWRRLGWLVAFALYLEPEIREKYDNVAVEDEVIYVRDPLWVPVTPDRVLRNKITNRLEYREYKTTVSSTQKWLHSWFYAIQLHLGLVAMSEELEEKVHFAQIMGLMKGYESQSDHRLVHPYVWGWYNHQLDKWSCDYTLSRGKDWVPMPVWEYPGGIVEWVRFCGPDVAKGQFPHSPPVFLNQRMLDLWTVRRLARQRQIRQVEEAAYLDEKIRVTYFEMKTGQCRPAFGDPCPYLPLCWNAEANANPLGSGDFIVREPHHDVEIVGIEGI